MFPRTKVCGCCLNGAAIATLTGLGLGHVLSDAVPIQRLNLAAGRRIASVKLMRGVALSRDRFDSRLQKAAVQEGVEFRPGTQARLGQDRPEGREVFLNGVPLLARVVVMASGLLGGDSNPEPGSRIGAGVMLPWDDADEFYTPGTIYMATGKHGYVGLVRVEGERLDLAAAFDPSFVKAQGGLGAATLAILSQVGWPVPAKLAEFPWKGTPALTRRTVPVASHRLFMVGDAAGYIEPFTGEGMAWAVMAAAALAPLAARAAGSWDNGMPREWEVTLGQILGHRHRLCRLIARLLRSPRLSSFAVRTLSLFPLLARPLVSTLNQPAHLPQKTTA
jgi:flavin-dependent dehydrogenase